MIPILHCGLFIRVQVYLGARHTYLYLLNFRCCVAIDLHCCPLLGRISAFQSPLTFILYPVSSCCTSYPALDLSQVACLTLYVDNNIIEV